MEGLQPVIDLNGNNNNNGWGNWGGGLIGGAIGGAVGSAWGRNGYNNMPYPYLYPQNHDSCVMDTLTTMRTDVNSIGRDQLIQTAGLQSTMCQGFGGVNSTVERVGGQLAQNQSRTEAAVYTAALQGQIQGKDNTIAQLMATHANEVQGLRSTFDIVASQKDCCCTTQRSIDAVSREVERQGCETRASQQACCCDLKTAIHEEGERTRALVDQRDREELLRNLAARDAKIAQLEAQQFNSGLFAAAAQQNRADTQAILGTIIARTTTPAASTPAA